MKKFYIPLLCLVLIFISCSNQDFTPYLIFDEEAYNTAKEKWENYNCKNYTFTYEINSSATGPNYPKVAVTVKNGTSTYEVLADSQEDLDRFDEYDARFVSAEYLFDYILEIYKEEKRFVEKRPEGLISDTIEVKYDATTGFPKSIKVYSSWTPGLSIDGHWWSIIITDIKFN